MQIVEDLTKISQELKEAGSFIKQQEVSGKLEALEKTANEFHKSFSGSWLGYHSCVYYRDLEEPPNGAYFNREYGLYDVYGNPTEAEWTEYKNDEVIDLIYNKAGVSDIDDIQKKAVSVLEYYEVKVSEIKSILTLIPESAKDSLTAEYVDYIYNLKSNTREFIISNLDPKNKFYTSDKRAVNEGFRTPPHIFALAEVLHWKHVFTYCNQLAQKTKSISEHFKRIGIDEAREKSQGEDQILGSSVFIGHGRDDGWRAVKEYIKDELNLNVQEFDHESPVGKSVQIRLKEMMNDCGFAIIIMTAEDENADGDFQARMNVIHEIGLFQGKLGFEKVIILLENGCVKFSNMDGIIYVPFRKGEIDGAFHKISKTLLREGIIQ